MTTDTKGNYSAAQVAELKGRAEKGPLNAAIAEALSKTELFKGLSSRSIISKIGNLGLPYESKAKAKTLPGAKAKDETVMDIQAEIRQFLNIPDTVSLNQKTGFIHIRAAVEELKAKYEAAIGELDFHESLQAEADEIETA